MKNICVYIFSFCFCAGHAQTTTPALYFQYIETGSYGKNFTTPFSSTCNQALLAEANMPAAAVYAEQRFMLKDLNSFALAIEIPSLAGGFGMAIRYFGGQNFSISQAGIGYGKKLSKRIDIGCQFNYNTIKLAGYGKGSNINFEIGSLWHITDKLHLGIHLYNPAGSKYGKDNPEKLAAVYKTGIGYEASDKLFISTEIEKEENQPLNLHVGLQYNFATQFFSKLGISSGSKSYFFGLGLKWNVCRLDVVTSYHNQLGFTPGLMLLFDLGTKRQVTEE